MESILLNNGRKSRIYSDVRFDLKARTFYVALYSIAELYMLLDRIRTISYNAVYPCETSACETRLDKKILIVILA